MMRARAFIFRLVEGLDDSGLGSRAVDPLQLDDVAGVNIGCRGKHDRSGASCSGLNVRQFFNLRVVFNKVGSRPDARLLNPDESTAP